MRITPEYLEMNADLHRRDPGFGGSGHKWASRVLICAKKLGARSVLDYGCGKGTLAIAIGDLLEVSQYDPAIPGLGARPGVSDFVVCTDVLEHVEPECLEAVVDDIVSLGRLGVLVAVACRPGRRMMSDGKLEHRIVQQAVWWKSKLRPRGFETIQALREREYAALLIKGRR